MHTFPPLPICAKLTMATNVLGPHLLLTLLTDALAAAGGGARVVFVASSSEQVGSLAALDDPTYVRYSGWGCAVGGDVQCVGMYSAWG